MAQSELVVGLDLGSQTTRALVVEHGPDGKIELLACGSAPTEGVRRGIVTDLDRAAHTINQAVADAERRARLTIGKIVVGVGGEHLLGHPTRGVGAVGEGDREVTRADVKRVVEQARQLVLPPERQVLQVILRQFQLDGIDGIKDPVGLSGLRLEVEAHVVTALSSHLRNLLVALERTGLNVVDLVAMPVAAGTWALTPQERELGVLLIDVGAALTQWAVFAGGEVLAMGQLPLGGERVTLDVAVGLGIVRDDAEKLKLRRGAEGDDPPLEEIVLARMAEIFELVIDDRARCGAGGLLPGGTVLCGGGASLKGIVDLAQEFFGGPVRLAGVTLRGERGAGDPARASAAGLALWGTRLARRSGRPTGWKRWLPGLLGER